MCGVQSTKGDYLRNALNCINEEKQMILVYCLNSKNSL